MSMSTARDPRARMRAEAYHSMAYAHGQLSHVSAAVSQAHVLLEGRSDPARFPFCRFSASVSRALLPSGGQKVEIWISQNPSMGCHW